MNTLKEYIISTMKVLPEINAENEISQRVDFLKQTLINSGSKGFALGISGGQDSALVGKLCQMAVNELKSETGKEYTFLALLLPYGVQSDIDDARRIATEFIDADFVKEFNIRPMIDGLSNEFNKVDFSLDQSQSGKIKDFTKGNAKARARMIVQYAYASQNQLLVVGCDHSAENVTGFFTLHGDGAADVMPIFGLNKRQGKELLKSLGADEGIYNKMPTADLLDREPGRTDEDELGMTYDQIDDYLESKAIPEEIEKKLENRFVMTDFKRHFPVTVYG